MSVNIELLLKEVSSDAPTGPNLEYDEDFMALTRMVDPNLNGGNINWKQVKSAAESLLNRTKHLLLAVWLTRALAHTQGLPGFCCGIQLIYGLMHKYWHNLHPALDTDDNDDPVMRVNILKALCDWKETIVVLVDAPLVSSKKVGQFSFRDYKVAKGEMEPAKGAEKEPVELSLIAAAFQEVGEPGVQQLHTVAAQLLEELSKLNLLLLEKVGSGNSFDFSPLTKHVTDVQKALNSFSVQNAQDPEQLGQAPAEEARGGSVVNARADATSAGVICSREDASKMMDKISEYYLKHEPSSPIPLLMQRAKKLSTLSFLEILKDLAPEGLKQAQSASGAVLDPKK